jgi:predicted transcriptional regulator
MERLFQLLGEQEAMRIVNLLIRSRRVTLLELEVLLNIEMGRLQQHLANLEEQRVIFTFSNEERQYYNISPFFIQEHEQLYYYLLDRLKGHVIYLTDLNRFNRYRLNRLSEQDIRDNRQRVLNMIQ